MEEKINIYYYVFMCNINGEEKYFNGFNRSDLWIDNNEYCYYTRQLSLARDMKRAIGEKFGLTCKIIKVSLLEVE